MDLGRGGGSWRMEAPKQLWRSCWREGGLAIFIRIAISGCFIRLVTPGKNHISEGFWRQRGNLHWEVSASHPEHVGLGFSEDHCVSRSLWPGAQAISSAQNVLLLLLWSHLRNLKSSLSFFVFVKLMVLVQADFILNLVLFWDFEYLKNMTNNLPLYTFCAIQPRSGSINVW